METIQVHCPYCAQVVTVRMANMGALLQCPSCPGKFRVPSNVAEPHREIASAPAYQSGAPAYQSGAPAYQSGAPAYQSGSRPYHTLPSASYTPPPSVPRPIAPTYNSYRGSGQSQNSNQMLVMMFLGIGVGIVCVVVAIMVVFAVVESSKVAPASNQDEIASGQVAPAPVPVAKQSEGATRVQNTQDLPGLGDLESELENPSFVWDPKRGVVKEKSQLPREPEFVPGRQPNSSSASGGNGKKSIVPNRQRSNGPVSGSFGETTKSVGDGD